MSDKEILKIDDDLPLEGLEKREYKLISRLNEVCVMLATMQNSQIVKELCEKWDIDHIVAKRWIAKAEDYMALGCLESTDDARRMYHMRLNTIYGLCMQKATRNVVKVVTKPMKLQVDGTDAFKEVMGTTTEVKHNVFDTAAINAALKAAREIAHIMGARPSNPTIGNQINVQVNNGSMPGAQMTQDLTNEQLSALVGVDTTGDRDVIEVLPEHIEIGAEAEDEVSEVEEGRYPQED